MKFILDKDKLTIDEKESLNSGSIKYYEIPVEYDETWEDLSIAAIIIKEHAEKGIATAVINHNVYVDKTTYGKYFIGFIGYIVEYSLTTDVAIDENKTYYTRSGDEGSYIYTKVDEPSVESISTYYEAEKTYQVTTKLTPVTFKQGAAEIEVEDETNIPSLSEWDVYVSQIEDLIDDANDVIDDMNTLITSVKANPVISDGVAYVVGYNGPLVAIDIRTGVKLWVKNIAASSQPWVAGKFIFILTNEGDLAAIEKETGKVAWSTIIPYAKVDKRLGTMASGPILTNDALLVVSSNGKLFSVSPYNGRIMGIADVEDDIETTPVMVNETLLLMSKDAELTAYK